MSYVFETPPAYLAKRVLVYHDSTAHKPFAPPVVEINKCSFLDSYLQVFKTHSCLWDTFLIAFVWLILFPLLILKAHLFQEVLLEPHLLMEKVCSLLPQSPLAIYIRLFQPCSSYSAYSVTTDLLIYLHCPSGSSWRTGSLFT